MYAAYENLTTELKSCLMNDTAGSERAVGEQRRSSPEFPKMITGSSGLRTEDEVQAPPTDKECLSLEQKLLEGSGLSSLASKTRLMSRRPSCHYYSIAQSCPTFWDLIDCSLPGSSVHGSLHTRKLEWVAISFSRGSS